MPMQSPELAEKNLQELAVILRCWKGNEESDSVTIQNLRSHEYSVAMRLAEELVYEVQPEHRLQVQVGRSAIEGCRFSRGVYDTLYEQKIPLEPGYILTADRTKKLFDHNTTKYNLFIGDNKTFLSLDVMAVTLTDGGNLSFASSPSSA